MNVALLKTDPALDETIEVEGTVAAPLARVWRAWTDPTDLARWFGREAGSVQSAEIDLRVGGHWRFRFSDRDEGGRLEGEYLTVEPERCLAFTWRHVADNGQVSPQSTVTVTFEELGTMTAIAIRHDGVTAESSRRNISGGWSNCLAGLRRLLTASPR